MIDNNTTLSAHIESPPILKGDAETAEIGRYLYSLAEQLNYILNDIYKNEAENRESIKAIQKKLKEGSDGNI